MYGSSYTDIQFNEVMGCSYCQHTMTYVHSYYRSLWSIRNYIHIMLCVSLFVAQLVFIIGIGKIRNEVNKLIVSTS